MRRVGAFATVAGSCLVLYSLCESVSGQSLGCLEESDAEFLYFRESVQQVEAITRCEEAGAALARVSSTEELVFIRDKLRNDGSSADAFIGIESLNDGRGAGNTERFEYLDGFEDTSFFEVPFTFPWVEGQEPNDASGLEDCVAMKKSAAFRFNDRPCTDTQHYICRRPCPRTETPTVTPTASPSASPTSNPTQSPITSDPTVSPTFEPTRSPGTSEETDSPTTDSSDTEPNDDEKDDGSQATVLAAVLSAIGILGVIGGVFYLTREKKPENGEAKGKAVQHYLEADEKPAKKGKKGT